LSRFKLCLRKTAWALCQIMNDPFEPFSSDRFRSISGSRTTRWKLYLRESLALLLGSGTPRSNFAFGPVGSTRTQLGLRPHLGFVLELRTTRSKHRLETVRSLFTGRERPAPSVVIGRLPLCLRVTNDPIQALSLDRSASFRVMEDQVHALSSD
jgi:hypothetical protein